MQADDEHPVKLHAYDLSQRMAPQLSTTTLDKPLQAVWHTGVVVYGKEYYFGEGIQQDRPGRTPYGIPVRVEDFRVTHVAEKDFEHFLQEIRPRYTQTTCNLLSNNCNSFSNEALKFLVGSTVPNYIFDMPKQAMNSPIGMLMLPMIQGLETTLRSGSSPQPPQFAPAPAVEKQAQPSTDNVQMKSRSTNADETGADKTVDNDGEIIPPTAAVQKQPSTNDIQIQSRSITTDKTSADKTADDDREIIPPAAVVQSSSTNGIQIQSMSNVADRTGADRTVHSDSEIIPPAKTAQTQPSMNDIQIQSKPIIADRMGADKMADDDSKNILPAVQPAPTAAPQMQPSSNNVQIKTTDDGSGIINPPTVKPATPAAEVAQVRATLATSPDPLREARNRAQEEIKREFAAIMATGTAQASEAAALATRRVMERYGLRHAATKRGG